MTRDQEPLRVAFGITRWAKSASVGPLDGIGVYSRQLWTALENRREAENCYTKPFSFGAFAELPNPSTPEDVFPSYSVHLLESMLLRRGVRRSDFAFPGPAVIHATDHLVPFSQELPVLATVMDLIPLLHPEWLRMHLKSLKTKLFEKGIRSADHIVTISEFSRESILDYFDLSPSTVTAIPLGVDKSFFRLGTNPSYASLLSRLGIAEDFFLFVGTIQPRKNINRLIDAHELLDPQLRRKYPLVIVGRNGWSADDTIKRLQALESRGFGKWLSSADNDTVRALLHGASALVHVSLYEGFGLPVLEAMAAGCPVIASKSTAIPEVGGEVIWYVDPYKKEEIAEAMYGSVLGGGYPLELVARATERARLFTWETCAEKTVQVYRSVAKSS